MACAQRGFARYVYGIIVIDIHVFISGGVCTVGFAEPLCAHSLTLINTHRQSLTGESERIFIFRRCWVLLGKVLSFGLFVTSTFIRRCYVEMGL